MARATATEPSPRAFVYKISSLRYRSVEMRHLVTEILTRFQKGEITLKEAADRLLNDEVQDRKAESDQRLRSLCQALQGEQNPAKIREIKDRLTHEFYHGDKAS